MTGRIACIGECMIELSQLDLGAGTARIGFAGDTANTATYLARLGADVAYVTNVGTDAFSDAMLAQLSAEGVDCTLVGRLPDRLPGLYAIETDSAGERSFRYWRNEAAARTLFSGQGPGLASLGAFATVYLSGITLAILPASVRLRLIAALGDLRARGALTVFDPNYRPRLWRDADDARDCFAATWKVTTIGLPSLDDERLLYPGSGAAEVAERLHGLGVAEVVVKDGAAGPWISAGPQVGRSVLPRADKVVDSSGAGDSFNAGYIAARLQGADPAAAAAAGHRLACAVIGHHGAIIPRAAMPLPGAG
jgi:2-dehydro-3-deoxygluconokinase